jgi:hypothetical protein
MFEDFENSSLQLLLAAQKELGDALDSVGGKKPKNALDNYKFWCSVYLGRASKAFLFLRDAKQIPESRFLVRPAIEMMIKLEALAQRPDLLYRIAYTETQEDRTWFCLLADAIGEKFDESEQQKSMERFKQECAKLSTSADLKDERISLRCLALIIGIQRYYDSHYRMYCRFTHASLRALIGNLDDVATDEDNVTMVLCVLSAIKSVVAIGGAAPNFGALHDRREALLNEKMRKDGEHHDSE